MGRDYTKRGAVASARPPGCALSNAEQIDLFLQVLLALGLGGAIGLEREVRGHEAGIRTTALVCAGAALFGLVGEELGDSRLAAAVVQGIGFLGAGLIFREGRAVHRLTTAASVWVTAAIGLLVAQDLWLAALLSSATVIVALELEQPMNYVARRLNASSRDAEPDRE